MRAIWVLITAGLLMLFVTAQAAPPTAEKVRLEFELLEGVRVDQKVELRFVLSQASWAEIQKNNIRPIIVGEVLSLDRQSLIGKAGIVQRTGRFFVHLPDDQAPHSVRFALQHPRVKGFKQAGVSVVTLTRRLKYGASDGIAQAKPKRPAPTARLGAPQPVSIPAALAACERYGKEADTCQALIKGGKQTRAAVVVDCGGYGKGHRVQCLREVIRTATPMSGAVRACAGRFAPMSPRLDCVRRAAVARVNPAAGVRACGAQFTDEGRALDCVARIAYASANAQGLVDTCANAFGGAEAQLDCIGTGARSRQDLSPAVSACTQAMPWQSNRKHCIEAAATAKSDLSSAVEACRTHVSAPDAVLRCIRHAAQGQNPSMARAINGCGRSAGNDKAFNSCVAQAASN
jgi:hypothetical protein